MSRVLSRRVPANGLIGVADPRLATDPGAASLD